MKVTQIENRLEVTEINNNIVTKRYYEIDSEIGERLIKDNNLEINEETQEV